jgi:putative membrane protein
MSGQPQFSSDELSRRRTVMSADRTMMSWTRTSLSMISFGFTIYKFLQYLREQASTSVAFTAPHGPRRLGEALIVLGLAALIIGGVQHWRALGEYGVVRRWRNASLFFAACVVLIGIVALMSVAFRIGPF